VWIAPVTAQVMMTLRFLAMGGAPVEADGISMASGRHCEEA
jgi:hypothetical protein